MSTVFHSTTARPLLGRLKISICAHVRLFDPTPITASPKPEFGASLIRTSAAVSHQPGRGRRIPDGSTNGRLTDSNRDRAPMLRLRRGAVPTLRAVAAE